MNLAWLTRGAASAERARRLMELRGVTPNGYRLWDGQETGDLIADVPFYAVAMLKLPRRTLSAAHSKASRLGITRPKAREWDENEIPRLRRIYPTGTRAEIEAAFPGRSYAAIVAAANSRKIYRAKKLPLPTGSRLLDQVLARAVKQGYTMTDLDLFGRSKSYFRQRKWRTRPDEAVHCHAARAMGGVLRAKFK